MVLRLQVVSNPFSMHRSFLFRSKTYSIFKASDMYLEFYSTKALFKPITSLTHLFISIILSLSSVITTINSSDIYFF